MTGWRIHFTTRAGENLCDIVDATERNGVLITHRQHVVFSGEYDCCNDQSHYGSSLPKITLVGENES